MSDDRLKFPDWQAPLQDLMLEFDRQQAFEKLQEVETLLFERLQKLRDANDGHIELQAIDDALALLRILKRDKLDYPDWK